MKVSAASTARIRTARTATGNRAAGEVAAFVWQKSCD